MTAKQKLGNGSEADGKTRLACGWCEVSHESFSAIDSTGLFGFMQAGGGIEMRSPLAVSLSTLRRGKLDRGEKNSDHAVRKKWVTKIFMLALFVGVNKKEKEMHVAARQKKYRVSSHSQNAKVFSSPSNHFNSRLISSTKSRAAS